MTTDDGNGLRRLGVATWSLLGTILLLGVVVWLVVQVWIIVPPILLAIAIVYVLNPGIAYLAGKGVARWLSSCLSYLVLLGVLTLAGFLVVPSLAEQTRDLADDFPDIYDSLISDFEGLLGRLGIPAELPDFEQLSENVGAGFVGERLERITDITLGVIEILFILLLAPVVAFYLLLDLPTAHRRLLNLVPERHHPELNYLGRQLGRAVGGFLRGQLFVALIVGSMTSFGLWLIDLPFWLVIGLVAGFLNIIPLIGPWVGGALGVLMALATRDVQTAVWAALVAVIVQQIDNNFVSPTVLRATVRLHPAVILLGLTAGAAIGGFWGLLFAVPVMAVAKILGRHVWRTRVLGQTLDEITGAVVEGEELPPENEKQVVVNGAEMKAARAEESHEGESSSPE